LSQVDSDLTKAAKAFKYYETHFPPTEASRYTDVGLVRCSLSIVNDGYLAIRKVKPSASGLKEYREARKKTQ